MISFEVRDAGRDDVFRFLRGIEAHRAGDDARATSTVSCSIRPFPRTGRCRRRSGRRSGSRMAWCDCPSESRTSPTSSPTWIGRWPRRTGGRQNIEEIVRVTWQSDTATGCESRRAAGTTARGPDHGLLQYRFERSDCRSWRMRAADATARTSSTGEDSFPAPHRGESRPESSFRGHGGRRSLAPTATRSP